MSDRRPRLFNAPVVSSSLADGGRSAWPVASVSGDARMPRVPASHYAFCLQKAMEASPQLRMADNFHDYEFFHRSSAPRGASRAILILAVLTIRSSYGRQIELRLGNDMKVPDSGQTGSRRPVLGELDKCHGSPQQGECAPISRKPMFYLLNMVALFSQHGNCDDSVSVLKKIARSTSNSGTFLGVIFYVNGMGEGPMCVSTRRILPRKGCCLLEGGEPHARPATQT
jgi:hypothetical protein